MGRSPTACCLATALVVVAPASAAELTFVEAGAAHGIEPYQMAPGMGGGLAAADYDDDGDVDVFVPTAEGTPDRLYRNLTVEGGPILFEEIGATVGLASLQRGRSAVWLDADGDRRLDLLVAGDCFQSECPADMSVQRLYRQTDAGTFVDVTAASGLYDDAAGQDGEHRGGLSAGDVDNDGDPDVFAPSWRGGTRLYRNLGDGTFADVSETSGAGTPPLVGVGPWQALIHDFDGDRRADLFVAVDFAENLLLMQQSDGTFADAAAAAGLDRAWNEMGIALGDVDNDGDFDLYVTNISDEFPGDGWRHSTLYLDESAPGELRFTEVAAATGVDDAGWGWGTTFLDADNDGLLDLAATNGFATTVDASRFFINQGTDPVTFREAGAEVGFDDDEWGSALAAFDVDLDGDLDLMQTCLDGPLRLLLNRLDGHDRHHLLVRPRRAGRYSRALGARVEVEIGATTQSRLITAGTSFMAQEPAEAFFGLGAATIADRVTVHWPGGGRTVLDNVAADQVLTVTDLLFSDSFESGDLSGWSAGS